MRIACSLEDREAHNANRKRDEIDRVDRGIGNGSADFGSRIGRERPTKEDMGVHGQACTAMVSYSIVNGKSAKDPTYGKIVGNNGRYRR